MERNYPEIIISDEGVTWLDKGQMWMYKNNLEQCDPQIKNGELVDIVTNKGRYLGTGFISLKSHITVRILSKDRKEIIDREFFKKRIQQAYDFRKTVEGDNLSNCRLIFGEADLLPGLVIDRYNDILVSQISSYGLEQIKDMIYEIVLDVLKADGEDVKGIYERNDIQIRTKEGLEQYKGYYKNKDLPTQTIINENGLLLHVDVENGQKTGYFLDQKSNRYLLRKIAHGKRVVDCFSHTGGFALNAAMGNASHVVSVDVSKTALDQGYQNAKLNHLEEKIDFVQADVFDYLDELKEIMDLTLTNNKLELSNVLEGSEILELRNIIKEIKIAEPVKEYALKLILATHPELEYGAEIAKKYVEDPTLTEVVVKKEDLEEYLGKDKYTFDLAGVKPEIGMVTGLAWTAVGGVTLNVEVNVLKGKGQVVLTGQLGDVMKESAQTAISYIRSISDRFDIPDDFYQTKDIHIHIPEGATPKDGPSAGVTMATAVISALTKIPVRCDVAMTGEITLRGRVLPVGGIKEKLLAAHRAGIKKVLLPEECKAQLDEIPQNVKDQMEFVLVKHLDEVLEHALVKDGDRNEN